MKRIKNKETDDISNINTMIYRWTPCRWGVRMVQSSILEGNKRIRLIGLPLQQQPLQSPSPYYTILDMMMDRLREINTRSELY